MAQEHNLNHDKKQDVLEGDVQEKHHTSESHHSSHSSTHHHSSGRHGHHHHQDSSERFKNRILMTAKRRKVIEKYLFRIMCIVATIVVLTCLYVYIFNPQ